MTDAHAPLQGVRVTELASFAGAPSCAAVLADWGASVVKVEPPWGDPSRGVAPNAPGLPLSPRFELHNRNKRSLALDLRSAHARPAMDALLARTDVLVTNLRPRSLERLDLAWESVREVNPTLIYAMFTAYGLGHDEQDRGSTDHGAFWSASGFVAAISRDRDVPLLPPGGLGDRAAGLALVGAICAALYRRERTGEGGLLHSSLFAVGPWLLGSDYSDLLRGGSLSGRSSRATSALPTLNPYQCRDGAWLWLSVLDPERHWGRIEQALAEVDAVPTLSRPPRTRHDFKELHAEIVAALDKAFATRDAEDWVHRLARHDVPAERIRTIDEVIDSDLAAKAELFGDAHPRDRNDASVALVRSPVRFDGYREDLQTAPRVGEDSVEVLREHGLGTEEIEALLTSGAVVAPAAESGPE